MGEPVESVSGALWPKTSVVIGAVLCAFVFACGLAGAAVTRKRQGVAGFDLQAQGAVRSDRAFLPTDRLRLAQCPGQDPFGQCFQIDPGAEFESFKMESARGDTICSKS